MSKLTWSPRSRAEWKRRTLNELGLRSHARQTAATLVDQLADLQMLLDRMSPRTPTQERLRVFRAYRNTLDLLRSLRHR